jgi:hypothetical protein
MTIMSRFKKKISIVLGAFLFCSFVAGALLPSATEYLRKRSAPPGSLEYEDMQELFGAQEYRDVVDHGLRAVHGGRCGTWGPAMLVLCWRASDRMHNDAEAAGIVDEYWRVYPKDATGSQFHFAVAIRKIGAGDSRSATKDLAAVVNDYPASAEAPFASSMLGQLAIDTSISVQRYH